MQDFLQANDDGGTSSYDDFVQSLMPSFSQVGAGSGSTGGVVMGFASAGLEFAAGDPVGGTLQALQTVLGSIGRGRKEADVITAVQTPVSQLLEQVNTEMGVASITVTRLQQLRGFVTAAGQQMQQVISQPWPDGRAAAQAKATMFGDPGYLRVTVANIDKMIAERSGASGPDVAAAAAGGGSGAVVLAAVGALAWLFLK